VVETAYKGFRRLEDEEVRSVYGAKRVMHWLNYPAITRSFEK